MAQRGRPKTLEDWKVRDTLLSLVSLGLTRFQAAETMGIARSTLYRTARQDPDFAQQLRTAEVHREVRPLHQIMEHMPRSWRCAAWFLERRRPDVFGRRGPNTVTLADLHGIFGAMMKLLLEGVAEPAARQRILKNFEAFFERLGGQNRCSARVKRAIVELELNQQVHVAIPAAAGTSEENGGPPSVSESAETASENPKNGTTE